MRETGPNTAKAGERTAGIADGIRRFWKILPMTFALSFVFSWQVSVLIMFSAVVHEASHLVTARRCGIRDEGIVFSFLKGGALIWFEDASPKERWMIAIAGPVSGAACAFACLGLHAASGADVFRSAAFWIATPVLLNIVPIFGKDGAMILEVVMRSVRSRGGENLSTSGIVIATVSFVTTTLVLAGIAFLSRHGLPSDSFLPFRFFF